uniref:GNAT family N-acetyltransferase n=1 Tax=Cupriavidus taiwanensis TaxID=164546 RepID=UPI003F494BFA
MAQPIQIHSIHRGTHHGQDDYTVVASIGDVRVGHLDYSYYQGVPSIAFIEVSPAHRRRGIATALAQALQAAHPQQEIEFGMLTADGAAWRRSLTMVSIPDQVVAEANAELELSRREREALLSKVELGERADFDRINALHDRIDEIEQELFGKSAVKQLIAITNDESNMENKEAMTRSDMLQAAALQLEPLRAKLFTAHWDASFEQPGERVQLERHFNAEAGYSDDDVARIRSLKVGESWTCPDYGPSHTVTRLPDAEIPEDKSEYIHKYLWPITPSDAKEAQHVLDGFESRARVEAGIVRWLSNRQVPPQPVLDLWKFAGKPFDIERSAKARDAEISDFLAQYRAINTGRKPSQEQFSEMRSVFGQAAQPMNVVTGDQYDLEREQIVQRPRMKP